jgi:hypothetical protein
VRGGAGARPFRHPARAVHLSRRRPFDRGMRARRRARTASPRRRHGARGGGRRVAVQCRAAPARRAVRRVQGGRWQRTFKTDAGYRTWEEQQGCDWAIQDVVLGVVGLASRQLVAYQGARGCGGTAGGGCPPLRLAGGAACACDAPSFSCPRFCARWRRLFVMGGSLLVPPFDSWPALKKRFCPQRFVSATWRAIWGMCQWLLWSGAERRSQRAARRGAMASSTAGTV